MSNETSQETWNATHSQLLKSVADAQAKLLAAQNETNDRLERQAKEILGLNETLHRIRDRLEVMNTWLAELKNVKVLIGQTQEAVRNGYGNISSRLDVIREQQIDTSLLAKPRRQVEKLRSKRIVKRAVERKR